MSTQACSPRATDRAGVAIHRSGLPAFLAAIFTASVALAQSESRATLVETLRVRVTMRGGDEPVVGCVAYSRRKLDPDATLVRAATSAPSDVDGELRIECAGTGAWVLELVAPGCEARLIEVPSGPRPRDSPLLVELEPAPRLSFDVLDWAPLDAERALEVRVDAFVWLTADANGVYTPLLTPTTPANPDAAAEGELDNEVELNWVQPLTTARPPALDTLPAGTPIRVSVWSRNRLLYRHDEEVLLQPGELRSIPIRVNPIGKLRGRVDLTANGVSTMAHAKAQLHRGPAVIGPFDTVSRGEPLMQAIVDRHGAFSMNVYLRGPLTCEVAFANDPMFDERSRFWIPGAAVEFNDASVVTRELVMPIVALHEYTVRVGETMSEASDAIVLLTSGGRIAQTGRLHRNGTTITVFAPDVPGLSLVAGGFRPIELNPKELDVQFERIPLARLRLRASAENARREECAQLLLRRVAPPEDRWIERRPRLGAIEELELPLESYDVFCLSDQNWSGRVRVEPQSFGAVIDMPLAPPVAVRVAHPLPSRAGRLFIHWNGLSIGDWPGELEGVETEFRLPAGSLIAWEYRDLMWQNCVPLSGGRVSLEPPGSGR